MVAMAYAGKILGSYALTFAGVLAYTVYTVRKGRELARRVTPEDRPWT